MKIIAILTSLFLSYTLFADGLTIHKVRFSDCPAPVAEAIQLNLRNGKLDGIKRATMGNQTLYLVEIDLPQDRDLDLQISPDGKIVEIREDILLKEAPSPVRTALTQLDGKLDDLRQHTDAKGVLTYHAEIDRRRLPDLNVILSADGKIISQAEEIDD